MTKTKAIAAPQYLDDHFLVQTDYINCNNWSIETGKGNEIIWTIAIQYKNNNNNNKNLFTVVTDFFANLENVLKKEIIQTLLFNRHFDVHWDKS